MSTNRFDQEPSRLPPRHLHRSLYIYMPGTARPAAAGSPLCVRLTMPCMQVTIHRSTHQSTIEIDKGFFCVAHDTKDDFALKICMLL
jgi:hypothetical protein